jgi:hypothetical protein
MNVSISRPTGVPAPRGAASAGGATTETAIPAAATKALLPALDNHARRLGTFAGWTDKDDTGDDVNRMDEANAAQVAIEIFILNTLLKLYVLEYRWEERTIFRSVWKRFKGAVRLGYKRTIYKVKQAT